MRNEPIRRILALLLCICMLATTAAGVMHALAAGDSTTVYFLNSQQWAEVGVYVYGDQGELMGGWPGQNATAAEELGGDWMKIEVPGPTPFSIIFFNTAADAQRAELWLGSNDALYVTADSMAYATQAEAEEAVYGSGEEPAPDGEGTTVYFLNSAKWAEVGAYVYNSTPAEALGGWGSTLAEAASELGGDWMKVTVPAPTPFNIIFYNTAADAQRAELQIPSAEQVYVTVAGQAYASQAEAEAAVNATPTTIYFLNWNGDTEVFAAPTAYVWSTEGAGEAAGGWPGLAAEEAKEIGEHWWRVVIPANASLTPFNVIFSDNGSNQIADVYVNNYTNNYITAAGDATVYTSMIDAAASVGITYDTTVYYLNSEGWETIGTYVYGDPDEALGSWPGVDAVPAPEVGDMWVKTTVPALAPFNIIFFNKDADGQRAELLIPSNKQVYVAGNRDDGNVSVFAAPEEAELAMGMGDPSKMTTVYFYNSRGWGDMYGYVFREEDGESITVGAGWPGNAAAEASELGENWWSVLVPRLASEENPFYITFTDGMNRIPEEVEINDQVYLYVIATGEKFASVADALAAAANDTYDDGCEDGPNTDIENYGVSYTGAGANLPYITYEAENAATNAQVLEKATAYWETIQSEASGRQAVQLNNPGDYVEFTLTEAANSLVLRYAMPDSADGYGLDNTLSLYVDGVEVQDLDVSSHFAWVYGSYPFNNDVSKGQAHRFFDETRLLLDETLPAGTTVRLQKDAADDAAYYVIDFIECELVAAPLTQPVNSLSVTDFGAVPNDGADDHDAFVAAIEAAAETGKEVWIPAGRFDLVEEVALNAFGVTIRGAGMWHTELYGAGAAFMYQGTSKFYDFSMTGVSYYRDDGGDLAGFEGNGNPASNITIQNIWMEHMKVGVWASNNYRVAIQGCRIRNTFADGINLCSGTHDSVVQNNNLRNTGDDCIAIWPWLADCSGNLITHNTVQVPTLANCIAIYGGGNNVADGNHVMDTIANGAGIVIGSEFPTAKNFTGPITIKNNVLDRCGSMQFNENYPIGAIWLWSAWNDMTTAYNVYGNVMNDCVHEAILLEANTALTGVNIQNNTINGAKHAVYEYLNGTGTGTIGNLTANGITDEFHVDNAPNFILVWSDEEIEEPTDPTDPEETEPVEDPTEESTEAPTEESTEESTDGSEEEATEAPTQGGSGSKPDTGDNSRLGLWMLLTLAAACGFVVLAFAKRKYTV